MSLAVSDILNDSLVQETIKALDGKGRAAPEQRDLDEHPVLQMLEKTGDIDSVTASAIVAEEMLRSSRNSAALTQFLPPQVGPIVRLLLDVKGNDDMVSGVSGLVQDGNPTALKISVALIAFSGTGQAFEHAKNQMGRGETQKMVREFIDISIEVLDALNDAKRWKAVSPALTKTFVEGIENLSAYETGRFRKQLLASSLEALKTELAAEGINLKTAGVIAAPAPQVPYTTSLKLTEVLNDPLVQKTLAALETDAAEVDLTTNPAFAALSRMNTLDSVTAAALIANDVHRRSADLPKPVKEVVDALSDQAAAFLGPLALFGTDNASVHKIGVGMLAEALTGSEFAKMQQELSGRQMKEQVGEIFEASLVIVDRVIETQSWKSMSPELIGQFTKAMENVKGVVEGVTRKKLLTTALQTLKSEVATGTAAEITGPQAGTAGPASTVKPAPNKGLTP